MSVSHPFIRRPIATMLLAIAVALGGLLGYLQLPVSSLPQVDFPTIQVTSQLPGANPDTMANLVAAPLERQLGQIPSLELMTSSSSYGITQITLKFALGRDIDAAAQDVQAAISGAGSTLPRNLPYPPTYSKVNPADAPIMTVALTSSTLELRDLSDIADTMIGQRLSAVSGVGHVSVQGGIKPAVRIQVDLARLAAAGLSMADIRTLISNSNVSGPKGSLDGAHQSYTIAANDQLAAAEAYRNLVLAYRGGNPVLLKDVARIVDGLENERVGGWYKGQPAVIIDVQRQPGANVIETVERIRQELPRLQRAIPAGAELTVVHDRTGTIRASIEEVQATLAIAVGLVVLVVLLFLRSTRATVIAGVALPISIVATFGVMWLCGFSLDNLSLMALTIGTGFVVDDAIVMIENIVRHIENGAPPFEAALAGAREIGFTVISLTFSLIAVFIPMLFMTGLVGRMFREFALTLTIVVLVSAVVSLTLTPMMCSRLLSRGSHAPQGNVIIRAFNNLLEHVIEAYRRSLEWVLNHERLTLLVTALTVVATIGLYVVMPKGFLPRQDTGAITAILEASPDISFAEMQRRQARVADAIAGDPDVEGVVSVIGVSPMNPTPNAGRLSVMLKPRAERSSTVSEVIERLKGRLAPIAGATVYLQPVQDIQISTQVGRSQYQYTLSGSDQAEVTRWSERLMAEIATDPALADVAAEAQNDGLKALVNVDRATAGRLGVSMQSVSDALNDSFGQRQISTIYGQANQYRVVLEADPRYQRDPATLGQIHVPSSTGQQIPLGAIATIVRGTAPLVVQRKEQFPAATISFNLAHDASLGDAIQIINAAEKRIGMPSSITGSFSGDAAEFEKSLAGQPWLILAAIIAIYIVLGVLYESLVHPFTILTTLPSAGIGALIALWLAGLDLSLVSLIGIILLMGIVKKNAILMIDFALDAEREHGRTPREAIMEAALLRFRPIMMTTLAALFGALPLAVSHGTGSELRIPLGISIIGGLLLSQLLTLYTTPVVYLAMERMRARISRALGHETAATPDAVRTPAE
ncbi:MAG: multidrug efflux RND transporter permease subunit [Hyphomicrobiaceae bacterium]